MKINRRNISGTDLNNYSQYIRLDREDDNDMTESVDARCSTGEKLARAITHFTGSSFGLCFCLGFIAIWCWLEVPTGDITWRDCATMLTLFMTFLIQRHHNKSMDAVHLKLDELIASDGDAANDLIKLERKSEKEIAEIKDNYKGLSQEAKSDQRMKRGKIRQRREGA